MATLIPLNGVPLKYQFHIRRYIKNVNLIVLQYTDKFINTRSTQEIDYMISDVMQYIEMIKDPNAIFSNEEVKIMYKELKSKYKKIYHLVIHSQPF
jgi:hypothetical protein